MTAPVPGPPPAEHDETAADRGAATGPEAAGGREDVPAWQRKWWYLPVALLVLLVGGVLVLHQRDGGWPPEPDCATTAVAVAADTVPRTTDTLYWAATGPAGGRYAVTIGVSTLSAGPSGAPAIGSREEGAPGYVAATGLPGCRATGRAMLRLNPGTYTAALWQLDGIRYRRLDTAELQVTR